MKRIRFPAVTLHPSGPRPVRHYLSACRRNNTGASNQAEPHDSAELQGEGATEKSDTSPQA
jgi:hypothetical protein